VTLLERPQPFRLDPRVRERAMTLAIYQGFLATCGAWMVGGTFLNYFAMELGATGTLMGVVLAVPNIASLLRIVAPYFVNRSDNRKAVWLGAVLVARLAAVGCPLLAFPQFRPAGIEPLHLLILVLCVTTIANAIAEVAWLSWFADVVPEGIWGRYFGRRNFFNSSAILVVPLIGGGALDAYTSRHPEAKLAAYATIFGLGILFHLMAVVPLLFVPNVKLRERRREVPLWHEILTPFRDPNFRRYALFYGWLMLGSGIPHAAFQLYQKNALGLGLMVVGSFQTVNRIFDMIGQRWSGRLTDRFGNKPIVILGLIGAATGPFFWIPTQPGNYWLIYISYVVWGLGWAGVGLGTQNLMLKISPRGNNVAYIAATQALGGISLSVFQIVGGLALDALLATGFRLEIGLATLNAYHLFFLLSFLGRSSAALWVFRVTEPGCRSIGHMLRALRRARGVRARRLARGRPATARHPAPRA